MSGPVSPTSFSIIFAAACGIGSKIAPPPIFSTRASKGQTDQIETHTDMNVCAVFLCSNKACTLYKASHFKGLRRIIL